MEFQGITRFNAGGDDKPYQQKYREKKLALIQKIPTPITPIAIDKDCRHITLAYFEQKSTVDYIGVVQGVPVCFDAKECAVDTFTMNNVHDGI
jgi:recombination protein U